MPDQGLYQQLSDSQDKAMWLTLLEQLKAEVADIRLNLEVSSEVDTYALRKAIIKLIDDKIIYPISQRKQVNNTDFGQEDNEGF